MRTTLVRMVFPRTTSIQQQYLLHPKSTCELLTF